MEVFPGLVMALGLKPNRITLALSLHFTKGVRAATTLQFTSRGVQEFFLYNATGTNIYNVYYNSDSTSFSLLFHR